MLITFSFLLSEQLTKSGRSAKLSAFKDRSLYLNVQVWALVCNATPTDLVAEALQVWLHTALVRQTDVGDCFK